MDLKFDKRVVLLPAAGLISAISNGDNHRYSIPVKHAMVMCVINDVLERQGTRNLYRSYGEPNGKVGFQFRNMLADRDAMQGAPDRLSLFNQDVLLKRVTKLLAEYNLYEACVASENGIVKNTLDAGFAVRWFLGKGKQHKLAYSHVIVEWTRPRLDYQSVSVSTFVEAIIAELVKRKYSREQAERTINAMPLSELLSSYPVGGLAEDIREHPHQTWEGLLQLVISRLKGGLK